MTKTLPSTKKRLFKRSKNKKEAVQRPKNSQQTQSVQKQEPRKYPRNNRFIPDFTSFFEFRGVRPFIKYLNLKNLVLVFLIVLGLVCLIWASALLYHSYLSWSKLMSQRQKLADKMLLWENIAKEYPNYRDAYVEGAIYAYRLGDKSKEQYFLSKLELLDPNFTIAKGLEQLNRLQQE